MKDRTRRSLAICAAVMGAAVLGYWYYAKATIEALAGMFEAIGGSPQVSESALFRILPYIGVALFVGAIVLTLLPAVRRILAKQSQ